MKEGDRQLQHAVEGCVDKLKEVVDVEIATAVSVFSSRCDANEKWLSEVESTYRLVEAGELAAVEELQEEYLAKLDQVESQLAYYEGLCDELEELQNELEVKAKLKQSRKS